MADQIKDCGELEAHLTPFVDGEEPPATRRSVEAHLAACPPCKQHADDETAGRELVRSHRDELRATAPPSLRMRCANLPSALRARPTPIYRRWVPLSLAATLILAVAGVFLFGVNNPVQALAASLTLDHVKCFTVTDGAPADASDASREWEQDHGWPISVPKASPDEQLTLIDVRHCLSSDGRAAHLMYMWRGAPLSLYVLPEDAGHAGVANRMGRDAVIWCANRRTYAVVADGHPRDLTRIVEYMKANAR